MMRRIVFFAATLAPALVWAAVDEGVFLEPGTGNYVVRYVAPADADGPEMTMEGIYYVHTKIQPVLSSGISSNTSTGPAFTYAFSVINGAASAQPLVDLWAPCDGYINLGQVVSPSGWLATVNMKSLDKNVRWGFKDLVESPSQATKGLQQGVRQDGFAFSSALLPGVGMACLSGNAPFETYSTQYLDPKSPLGIQIDGSLKEIAKNDHVSRVAALPTIVVPEPLNSVPVLEALRAHVAGWPAQQLMDQNLWVTVDSLLKGAIEGLKKSDTKGPALNLAQIRVELRKKYPDLDVSTALDNPRAGDVPRAAEALRAYMSAHDLRLAAKVLDFDVRFVSDRLVSGPVQAVDTPAPTMPPASDSLYVPPRDFDGAFTVVWSSPTPRVAYEKTFTVSRYELEMATDPEFRTGTVMYAGPLQSYRVGGLTSGRYWFRVRALWRVEYNGKPDPDVWSGYFIGPNQTDVGPAVPALP